MEDPARERWRDDVADLLELAADVRRVMARAEVSPESPAVHYRGLAAAERGSAALADRVVVVADLWSLIAADQIHGLAVLLRSNASVFSLFPLCRSIIEHSCSLTWVLDPAVSPEARCARAALAVDRSNEELCKAAAHLGGKGTEIHADRRRVMKAHRELMKAEFPIDTDLDAGVIAGQKLIGPTDVLRHFGDRWGDAREWEGIYDYLCATATHPTLSGFEFFAVDDDGNVRGDVSADFLGRLFRATLVPFLKALEHYQLYCGWDDEALSHLIDQANEVFPDILPGDA